MLAKIRPTSPRGIIPMPMRRRSLRVPIAPYAESSLPTMAMASSTDASSSTLGCSIAARSALTPMSTKNTGMSTPPTLLRSPAMRSC